MEEQLDSTSCVETPRVPSLKSNKIMSTTIKKHDSACADCGSARSNSMHENSSSFMSNSGSMTGDSGYITETPNSANSSAVTATTSTAPRISSANAHTPVLNNSISQKRLLRSNTTTTSTSGLRRRYHNRVRNSEHFQSERPARVRSKFNSRLEASESLDSCASSSTSCTSLSSSGHKNQSLNSELESLMRSQVPRNDENHLSMSSVPKTPASTTSGLDILSPPPSPAVPSLSFVASEPVDQDDVEMKLVIVPQSTPQTKSSDIVILVTSPTTSRSSPVQSSIESHSKLSKMMLTDLSMSDIRPKRLDFSSKPKYLGLKRTRAIPDQSGRYTVDFMRILGEESDHRRIVSKILSLLRNEDLCSISMVSKTWWRICANDKKADVRRREYVVRRQNVKENLKLIWAKGKAETVNSVSAVHSSNQTIYVRKGLHLQEVQNIIQGPANTLTPSSPPVSPSKVKFHSFVKVS